jgi:hypothetical protein
MSETDQFWQYAREAMHLACDAKPRKDKHDLLELADLDASCTTESIPTAWRRQCRVID